MFSGIPGPHEADHQRLLHADERELTLISYDGVMPFAAGTHYWVGGIPGVSPNGIVLIRLGLSMFFNTAQSAAIYYNTALVALGVGGAADATLTAPADTKLFTTAARWEQRDTEYNVLIPNTNRVLRFNVAIGGGAPGTFYCVPTLVYKLL